MIHVDVHLRSWPLLELHVSSFSCTSLKLLEQEEKRRRPEGDTEHVSQILDPEGGDDKGEASGK